MKRWARFLKRAKEEQEKINLAIVAANNHYAGFGPGTAYTFRIMLDLSEVTCYDFKLARTDEDKSLLAEIQSKVPYQIF